MICISMVICLSSNLIKQQYLNICYTHKPNLSPYLIRSSTYPIFTLEKLNMAEEYNCSAAKFITVNLDGHSVLPNQPCYVTAVTLCFLIVQNDISYLLSPKTLTASPFHSQLVDLASY